MLIEFSVSNFLSFRDKQTFSMVASSRLKRQKENTFAPKVEGETLPKLLKVAAIYGPNASGKSNVLQALGTIRKFSNLHPTSSDVALPVQPFRFDPKLTNEPSEFEIHFVCANQRYQFNLSATSERILRERLICYPKGKETLLYERKNIDGKDIYELSPTLEGGKDVHEVWKKLTSNKVLFIRQAVLNSSEDLQQLRQPFSWLSDGVFPINREHSEPKYWIRALQGAARQIPGITKLISDFLNQHDVPITSVNFEYGEDESKIIDEGELPNSESFTKWMKSKHSKTTLIHKSNLGEASFDLKEESDGTRALMAMWLPLQLLTDQNRNPYVLSIDELDSSLHPQIVANLVKRHIADNGKQLIFSTHDTHLMDTKLLRRDQIWFVERDQNAASQLRSMSDFKGRESEDIEKRYFEGRYRALPVIQ